MNAPSSMRETKDIRVGTGEKTPNFQTKGATPESVVRAVNITEEYMREQE